MPDLAALDWRIRNLCTRLCRRSALSQIVLTLGTVISGRILIGMDQGGTATTGFQIQGDDSPVQRQRDDRQGRIPWYALLQILDHEDGVIPEVAEPAHPEGAFVVAADGERGFQSPQRCKNFLDAGDRKMNHPLLNPSESLQQACQLSIAQRVDGHDVVRHAHGQHRFESDCRAVPIRIGAAQGLQNEELILPISGAQPPVDGQCVKVAGEPAGFQNYVDSH